MKNNNNLLMVIFLIICFSAFGADDSKIRKINKDIILSNVYLYNYNIQNIVLLNNNSKEYKSNEIYLKINKVTNGSYIVSAPTVEFHYIKNNFIYNPKLSLNFTSPMEDIKK